VDEETTRDEAERTASVTKLRWLRWTNGRGRR